MKTRLPQIFIKISLVILEFIFVGALLYARILNTGWMMIILGIGLLIWLLIHLDLMAVFIASFKPHIFDILLYLTVHLTDALAWLFQSDGGDSDLVTWTIQKIIDPSALTPFLK